PGRVELVMLGESLAETTIEVEYVHDAMTLARYIVMLFRVLHRKGHKKLADSCFSGSRRVVMLKTAPVGAPLLPKRSTGVGMLTPGTGTGGVTEFGALAGTL